MRIEKQRLPSFDSRIQIGSDLHVSPVCIGAVPDPRTIPAAFELGINFFFVSTDMHWPFYEGTRRGLSMLLQGRAKREDIIVAGVSYVAQPEFLTMPFQELVDAVPGLESLDITVAGGCYKHDVTRRFPMLVRHRESQFLGSRCWGASFHERAAILDAVHDYDPDVAFVRYNPLYAKIRDEVFDKLPSTGVPPMYAFSSSYGLLSEAQYASLGLSSDYWRPTRSTYIRFAMSESRITGLLCAPSTPKHVAALADTFAAGPLDEEELDYLEDLAALSRGQATLADT